MASSHKHVSRATALILLLLAGAAAAATTGQPGRRLFQAAPGGPCGSSNGGASCGNNQCCSLYGWCGTTDNHCGAGCQSDFGRCFGSSGSTPSTPGSDSSDTESGAGGGPCGSSNGGASCGNGQCCSQYGWCGTTDNHCGAGCQSDFGRCFGGSDSTPTTPGSDSSDTDSGAGGGPCGSSNGGASCGNGQCCSQYGWCGTTDDHCGAGCQSEFGACGSSDTSDGSGGTDGMFTSNLITDQTAADIRASMPAGVVLDGTPDDSECTFTMPTTLNRVTFDSDDNPVVSPNSNNFDKAAEAGGISVDVLKQLNPQLDAMEPSGGMTLVKCIHVPSNGKAPRTLVTVGRSQRDTGTMDPRAQVWLKVFDAFPKNGGSTFGIEQTLDSRYLKSDELGNYYDTWGMSCSMKFSGMIDTFEVRNALIAGLREALQKTVREHDPVELPGGEIVKTYDMPDFINVQYTADGASHYLEVSDMDCDNGSTDLICEGLGLASMGPGLPPLFELMLGGMSALCSM